MLSKQMNITQPMLKGLQQLSPMPCHSTTGVGPEHCEGGYPQYCLVVAMPTSKFQTWRDQDNGKI